jgi:CubicO group peptidase (beta-lactamase class C family)
MKLTKLLFGSFALGAGLAATHLVIARSTSEKPASRNNTYDPIDKYIEGQMRRLHIPGASLAIVKGNEIVHSRGFGRARPGGEVPSVQTPFFIGSLTKSITALAVKQLVEKGKIELDAPIQRYLPWFRVADPVISAQITVRHLLNHTSGLPGLPNGQGMSDFDQSPDAAERQVRALSTLKINRPVGSRCEYSNYNYNILGLIVEAVTCEAYENYIQAHVFDPLEMRRSYFSKEEARRNGLARGHRHWFSIPFPAPDLPIPRGSIPSGQVISCAEDMAHYLIAHLNGGRYRNRRILSAAGIDELHRGAKEMIFMGIESGKYGMGWVDMDLGSIKTYSHSGNVPDFSAYMALVPGQKKGVVLLLNADPYGLPPITEEVGMNVTALLAGEQPAPIRLEFIQWVMRFLPLIPLLQVVEIIATLRRLERWRSNSSLLPKRSRFWGEHILLPLAPNLALAGLLAYLQFSGLIHFLDLFMPDIAWIARISGGIAGIWAFLRTRLFLHAQKEDSQFAEAK